MKRRWRGSSAPGLIVGLVLIALASFVVWQRVWIVDSIRVMQYEPTTAIQQLVDTAELSDEGEFLLYASRPSLESSSTFNATCDDNEETSVVLGCYLNQRIYLFNVDNDELDGIEEVTAAHELLHAAYDRLSTNERERIDTLVATEVEKRANDKDFAERVSVYDKVPEADKRDELHSIIGTEKDSLNSELEAHYGQYFDDRSKIVSLYDDYSGVFKRLQEQAEQLVDSLDRQATSINQRTVAYNAATERLNTAVASFNARASANNFDSQAVFDANRSNLVNQANSLEAERRAIAAAIDSYNQSKANLDELSAHLTDLNNSIDSSLEPAPSV